VLLKEARPGMERAHPVTLIRATRMRRFIVALDVFAGITTVGPRVPRMSWRAWNIMVLGKKGHA